MALLYKIHQIDHYSVFALLDLTKHSKQPANIFKKSDWFYDKNHLLLCLSTIDWFQDVYSYWISWRLFWQFAKKYSACIWHSGSIKDWQTLQFQTKHRNWLSSSQLEEIIFKNMFSHKHESYSFTKVFPAKYKEQRIRVSRLIKQARAKYYKQLVLKQTNNPRKL